MLYDYMTFDLWVSFWQFLLPKNLLFSMMAFYGTCTLYYLEHTQKTSKDHSFGILNNLNQNRKKKSDRMQIKTLHVNKQS